MKGTLVDTGMGLSKENPTSFCRLSDLENVMRAKMAEKTLYYQVFEKERVHFEVVIGCKLQFL